MTEADAMTEAELRVALAMVEMDLQRAREENLRFEALAKEAAANSGKPTPPSNETSSPDAPIPMKYSCTRDWVYGWLSGMTHKPLMRWCDQWDHHPEAVVRLTALWQSWEVARASPSPFEMSRWILEHHDRHMNVLTATDGPFTECGRQGHVIPRAVVPPDSTEINVSDRQLQRA